MDAMGQMDRRVNSGGSELPAAKETQATEVPMVTLETWVSVVHLELMARREILVVLEDLAPLAHLEMLDQRENEEVLDHLVPLGRKETQDPPDFQESEENWEETETTGQRAVKDLMDPKEKRVKWGQRA